MRRPSGFQPQLRRLQNHSWHRLYIHACNRSARLSAHESVRRHAGICAAARRLVSVFIHLSSKPFDFCMVIRLSYLEANDTPASSKTLKSVMCAVLWPANGARTCVRARQIAAYEQLTFFQRVTVSSDGTCTADNNNRQCVFAPRLVRQAHSRLIQSHSSSLQIPARETAMWGRRVKYVYPVNKVSARASAEVHSIARPGL